MEASEGKGKKKAQNQHKVLDRMQIIINHKLRSMINSPQREKKVVFSVVFRKKAVVFSNKSIK